MFKRDYVVHPSDDLAGIRRAAAAAAEIRDVIPRLCAPGMTTKELDDLAAGLILSKGGTSAFHNYRGFPGQICISINDEVVHGIGVHARKLAVGDLVSVDIGIKLNGFIGDTAVTFILGCEPPPETAALLRRTREALDAGIAACVPGNHVRDISAAVEAVAKRNRLGVVRDYVGHGCGRELHEPPEVPNFVNSKRGARLRPGMVLCVEPMFNLGTYKVFTGPDKWTVRTSDAKLSAHFEHMVLITEKQAEILTCPKTS